MLEWWVWIAWQFLFCVRYARVYWIYQTLPNNPPICSYMDRINNHVRLVFKMQNGYKLELQTPKKLFGSTKQLIDKEEWILSSCPMLFTLVVWSKVGQMTANCIKCSLSLLIVIWSLKKKSCAICIWISIQSNDKQISRNCLSPFSCLIYGLALLPLMTQDSWLFAL